MVWQTLRQHRYWLSAALGLVFLVLAFRDVRLSHTVEVLGRANPWPLTACVFIYAGLIWLRSLRWRFLLRPLKEIPTAQLFPLMAIGYMANNLLPARIGDFVRAWLVGNRAAVSKTAALATILLERVFDAAATLLLLAVFIPFLALPPWVLQGLVVVTLILVLATVGAALLVRHSHGAVGRFHAVQFWVPAGVRNRTTTLMAYFLEGFRILRHRNDSIAATAASLGIWAGAAAIYYAVMLAFDVPASPWGALLVTALVNVSLVIPSPPGYVGTFELAAMIGYGLLDIPPDTAAVLTVATHAMLFFPGTVIGLICLWRENLSIDLLGKSAMENDKIVAPTT